MASINGKANYFREGSLLNRMEISVVEYERRSSDYLKDPYVVYLVEARSTGPSDDIAGGECTLWRRYSDFELLHRYLTTTYPYLVMPALPEKRLNVSKFHIATDKFDPEFLERRRLGLECFLLRLASHPLVSQDSVFLAFLHDAEDWKEGVGGNQWKEKLDARFKIIAQNVTNTVVSAGMTGVPRDERFEKMFKYGEFLEANIGAVLKVHGKMLGKTCSVLKQHAGYATAFKVWATIETTEGAALNNAAAHMDAFSVESTNQLKGEETAYLDQLKEYLYMSTSLKNISQKHQSLQIRLANADEKLQTKRKQKEELIKDIHAMEGIGVEEGPPQSPSRMHSLVSLVMGANQESLEDKQVKLLTVDGHVTEAEMVVKATDQEVGEFVSNSLKDYERFNRQKVRDVSEIMEHYVSTQVNINRLGLQQWKAIREAFLKL